MPLRVHTTNALQKTRIRRTIALHLHLHCCQIMGGSDTLKLIQALKLRLHSARKTAWHAIGFKTRQVLLQSGIVLKIGGQIPVVPAVITVVATVSRPVAARVIRIAWHSPRRHSAQSEPSRPMATRRSASHTSSGQLECSCCRLQRWPQLQHLLLGGRNREDWSLSP